MGKAKKTKKTLPADSRDKPHGAFPSVVNSCIDIKGAFMPGLAALKSNSHHVKAADTTRLTGSVDIDAALKSLYPHDARWDYVVGYGDEAYFIEVHPASTSNVAEMIKKVNWLKNWLASSAPDLMKLHKQEVYYWVPSGGVGISKGSVQYKRIALSHLQIKKPVTLP